MNKKTLRYIPLLILVASVYCIPWLDSFLPQSEDFFQNETPSVILALAWRKPFIFRILTILFARYIHLGFGIIPELSIIAVILISSVFMFFGMIYFFRSFLNEPITPAFVCCMAVFILSSYYRKPYDLSTVGFFAIALGLLERRRLYAYLLLFPLATLNRETTFLLTLFFAVHFFRTIPWMTYISMIGAQGFIYIVIKGILTILFAHNAGQQFEFNLRVVLTVYAEKWTQTLMILFILSMVLILVFWKWDKKPAFLRTAFITFFPLQVILHILMGYAFELRVLAESVPIIFLLCILPAPMYFIPGSVIRLYGGK